MFFRCPYPEKLNPNRIPNIHIVVRCGIGDIYAFLARIPSLKMQYPKSKIYFHVGGWDIIPFLIADVLKPYREIDGVHVLEDYYRRSDRRLKRMLKYVKSKTLKGDLVLNWIPRDSQFDFEMTHPFKPTLYEDDHQFADDFFTQHGLSNKNTIAVHPITTKGNADVFEKERFWSSEKWQVMVNMLIDNGYKILLIGAKGEEHGLKVDDQNIFSFQGTTIRQTMAALIRVKGILGTNSWTWEVAGYYGLPAAVIWTIRSEFIYHYLPNKQLLPHTIFETNPDGGPEELCNKFLKMLKENF